MIITFYQKTELMQRFQVNNINTLSYNAIKLKLSYWRKNGATTRFLDPNYRFDTYSALVKSRIFFINVKISKSKVIG